MASLTHGDVQFSAFRASDASCMDVDVDTTERACSAEIGLQDRDCSLSAQVLADLELLLERECCRDDGERIVLNLDFLLLSDEFPETALALLTDPGRVLSLLRHKMGSRRVAIRPFNLFPEMRMEDHGKLKVPAAALRHCDDHLQQRAVLSDTALLTLNRRLVR